VEPTLEGNTGAQSTSFMGEATTCKRGAERVFPGGPGPVEGPGQLCYMEKCAGDPPPYAKPRRAAASFGLASKAPYVWDFRTS